MDVLLGAVVVTYNSASCIVACLEGLASRLPEGSRISIVDNASTDDTVGLVKDWMEALSVDASRSDLRVSLTGSERNVGFGTACNLAVKNLVDIWEIHPDRAADRWVLLVNPDVVVEAFDVSSFAATGRDCRVGALALAQRVESGGDASARIWPLPGAWSMVLYYSLGMLIPGRLRPERLFWRVGPGAVKPPRWASGGFLAVRLHAWLQIGGFDERFFLFWEDVDLGRRLQMAGWSVEPSAVAVGAHLSGRDADAVSGPDMWKLAWGFASWLTYLRIWRGRSHARLAASLALIAQVSALVVLALPSLLPGPGAEFRRKSREIAALAGLAARGLLGSTTIPRDQDAPDPTRALKAALS